MQVCIDSILLPLALDLAQDTWRNGNESAKGTGLLEIWISKQWRFKLNFQWKFSRLSFEWEGLELGIQSWRAGSLILMAMGSIYSQMVWYLHTWIKVPKIVMFIAWMHGRVIGPCNHSFRSKIEYKHCWSHIGKPCNCVWKFQAHLCQMVIHVQAMHKSLILCPNGIKLDFLERLYQ